MACYWPRVKARCIKEFAGNDLDTSSNYLHQNSREQRTLSLITKKKAFKGKTRNQIIQARGRLHHDREELISTPTWRSKPNRILRIPMLSFQTKYQLCKGSYSVSLPSSFLIARLMGFLVPFEMIGSPSFVGTFFTRLHLERR